MIVLNLLLSTLSGGGRTSRYADFVVVTLPAMSFATTAQEFQQVQTWARSKTSLGNVHRDRTFFVGRFETVLARSGGGLATRGSRSILQRIIAGMKQGGMQMEEWSIPHNINESVEVKRRPAALDPAA
ncbi:hypothetical protein D0B54_12275 [Solimonas sp. K1W22B-7]|uniref:hypothetical protein n=1 Tax=Solimonas sp. K1W22B-7 TaxID=2303331 RepID=UPI000E3333C2|nr:hypothetical protein [Solimonas sp. K1W22B-7]AXQ29415.1 hypothetical protein D0B54_12275 [Solimonas sp. K1W22B-7]